MKLFKRKKRSTLFEIPIGVLARQTVYDSLIGDPVTMCDRLGFPPVSKEVSEMETRASRQRLDAIAPLHRIVDFQAHIVAETSATYQMGETPFNGNAKVLESVQKAYTAVGFATAIAVVSSLVDLGLLRVGGDE